MLSILILGLISSCSKSDESSISGSSNKNIAKYWKNGVATNIVTDASLASISYSIFVN